MKRFITAGLVGLSLSVMGCSAPEQPQGVMSHISPARSEVVTSFSFAPGGVSLSGAEQRRLRGFVQRAGLTPRDRIIVTVPAAASPRETAVRAQHLRNLFAGTGAGLQIVTGDPPERGFPAETSGILRLLRVSGVEVRCVEGALADGCSNARNLGVMLREPSDLLMPEGAARSRNRSGMQARASGVPLPAGRAGE